MAYTVRYSDLMRHECSGRPFNTEAEARRHAARMLRSLRRAGHRVHVITDGECYEATGQEFWALLHIDFHIPLR